MTDYYVTTSGNNGNAGYRSLASSASGDGGVATFHPLAEG